MKLKILLSIFITSAVMLNSCQKDIDEFIPDPGQVPGIDSNWVASITSTMPVSKLKESLLIAPQIDSFNNNAISPLTLSSAGLGCYFLPNSFVNASGTAATGMVQTEINLFKKKGDLIRMDKPTQSNGRMLVTGGVIYIKVKQNGTALSLNSGTGFVMKFPEANPNPQMRYFFGEASSSGEFNWVLPTDSQSNRVISTNTEYQVYSKNLNWINCDYFYDTTGIPRTTVEAKLPFNYTNANTEVFLAFKEIRSVLGMYGTPATKVFSTQKIPAGKPAYIVVLSKQGNDFFFAHEAVITGTNAVSGIQKINLTPVKSSLAEIKTWLDTL